MHIYVVLRKEDISIKGYLNPIYFDDKEVIKENIVILMQLNACNLTPLYKLH